MKQCSRMTARAMLLACVGMASVAGAQDEPPRIEITPFAAWRVGGEFQDTDSSAGVELRESSALGITVNGAVAPNTQWEVFYARQATEAAPEGTLPGTGPFDMDVDYLQLGGTYLFAGETVTPFIAATIGAARFDPKPGGFSAKTFFSGSIGGGWKLRLARNVGIRLEVRGYGTLVDSDNRLFCQSDAGGGACLIILDGKLLTQWEARAGLMLRFR